MRTDEETTAELISRASGEPRNEAGFGPKETDVPVRLRGALRKGMRAFTPGRLWYYSTRAHQANWHIVAWLLKAISFVLFKSVLCVQCKIEDDIALVHMGVGCVVHPNVTIGRGVKMYHHVSLAAETRPGSPSRIVIEDGVVLGMHAIILGNDDGGITIGKGAIIGAGAIVNRDVPPGAVVLPMPSRPVKQVKPWS